MPALLLALAMVAFSVHFAGAAVARHEAFVSGAQDLGYFDQTIWGSSRGRPLHFTVYDLNLTIPQHQTFLAYHVEPLLVLISPIYWLWDDVRALLILQPVVLALAAIPAYRLGCLKLGSAWAGLAIGVLLLLNPTIQAAPINDFHTLAFAPLFLLWALLALAQRRWLTLAIWCGLAILIKEQISLMIAMIGLAALIDGLRYRWPGGRRQAAVGAVLLAGGAAWFWLSVMIIIPAAAGNQATDSPFVARYGQFGDGLGAMARTFLTRPDYVWQVTPKREVAGYWLTLLLGGGLLPLASPLTLLAAPELAINSLSSFDAQRVVTTHYSLSIVAFIVAGAADGAGWLAGRLRSGEAGKQGSREAGEQERTGKRGGGEAGTRPEETRPAVETAPWGPSATKPACAGSPHPECWPTADGSGQEQQPISPSPGFPASRLPRVPASRLPRVPAALLLVPALLLAVVNTVDRGSMPGARHDRAFVRTTRHAEAAALFARIGPADSVVAQENLLPHLSHRLWIYPFAYGFTPPRVGRDQPADWVLLDVPAAVDRTDGRSLEREAYAHPDYGVVAADNGYLLLRRGVIGRDLPSDFTRFALADPLEIHRRDTVTSGDGRLTYLGTTTAWAPDPARHRGWRATIASYWQAEGPLGRDYRFLVADGDHLAAPLFAQPPTTIWLPSSRWPVGSVIRITHGILGVDEPMDLTIAALESAPAAEVVVRAPLRLVPPRASGLAGLLDDLLRR